MYVCLKSQRERERIEQKMTTTNDVGKLDDFSHAEIRRHHTSATAAAIAEKDDEEARNAGSRHCRVLIFTLFSIVRSPDAHD